MGNAGAQVGRGRSPPILPKAEDRGGETDNPGTDCPGVVSSLAVGHSWPRKMLATSERMTRAMKRSTGMPVTMVMMLTPWAPSGR